MAPDSLRGVRALLAMAAVQTLLGLTVPPLGAAGFDFQPQSARAMGMGGAFTAQASDPSAIFYNPGGLALLQKKKAVAAGVTTTALNESLYQGLPPGPGTGTTGEQETPLSFVPHAYLTLPLGERIVGGVGAYSPFRMRTEWADADRFAGRFTAVEAELQAYDLAPTIAFRLGETVGVGVGLVYRMSEVSVSRRLGAELAGQRRDIASLAMDTDLEPGVGWSAGLLHRPGPRFSWGISYRSAIEIDYLGVGRLTQIPTGNAQFDQLVGATFPFDQDLALSSGLELPDQATLGVAVGLTPSLLLEVDAGRTGWGSVQELGFTFSSAGSLDTRYRLGFEDAASYRAGLRLQLPTGPQIRAGYSFEESPQPDTTVGAFLADSDRSTVSAGLGLDWLDAAFSWTTYDQRIVTGTVDGLNGNYRANAWSFVISVTK